MHHSGHSMDSKLVTMIMLNSTVQMIPRKHKTVVSSGFAQTCGVHAAQMLPPLKESRINRMLRFWP